MARLVVTGPLERQAAAELYVSVKTVKSRPGHIFAKFGIRSPAVAPAGASEPDLGSHLG